MTTLYDSTIRGITERAYAAPKFAVRCGSRNVMCDTLAQCQIAFNAYCKDLSADDLSPKDGIVQYDWIEVARFARGGRVYDVAGNEIEL